MNEIERRLDILKNRVNFYVPLYMPEGIDIFYDIIDILRYLHDRVEDINRRLEEIEKILEIW